MPNHFLNYPRRPILFLIATFSVSATASEIDATVEIRRCAAIGDGAERVACYEELGRQVTAEPAAESTSTAGVAAASTAAVDAASAPASVEAPVAAESTSATTAAPDTDTLPDDLGGEKFSEKEAMEEQEQQGATGTVTRCQKGPDRKWYFAFASGQVWKQLDDTRLRFDECDFTAVIEKDLFGYKMAIEGRNDKIRVSRRK